MNIGLDNDLDVTSAKDGADFLGKSFKAGGGPGDKNPRLAGGAHGRWS